MFKTLPAGGFDYADSDVSEWRVSYTWWQLQGLSQTATGYGKKLTTSRMVRIGTRWHRVYCVCYSNIGTCYIVQHGERRIIQGDAP